MLDKTLSTKSVQHMTFKVHCLDWICSRYISIDYSILKTEILYLRVVWVGVDKELLFYIITRKCK